MSLKGFVSAGLGMMVGFSAMAEVTIFDVRKNLPMSDTEKVYRDFYINGGSESGIAKNMIITVERRLPLYDSYQNHSAGDLQLKVAKVKIIHVQKGLSVGRLQSEFDRATSPLLEDNFIMVGDRLDLATAVQDKSDKASNEGEERPEASINRPPPNLAAQIPSGQIVVNSVDLSSQSSPQTAPASATPVNVPIQQ